MGVPQGYTALGLVGYTDKGTYLASATYNRYNVVLYNGSSYVAIKDGITGITPSNDGVNWRLFANGFPENGISTDNFQDTLKQYISNSGTVNQEGFALDARQANPNVEGSIAAQLNTLSSGILSAYASGTTTSDGTLDITNVAIPSGATSAYCLTNVSQDLEKPWSVTVGSIATSTVRIRIRNMSDNSAVANKTVSFPILLIFD